MPKKLGWLRHEIMIHRVVQGKAMLGDASLYTQALDSAGLSEIPFDGTPEFRKYSHSLKRILRAKRKAMGANVRWQKFDNAGEDEAK